MVGRETTRADLIAGLTSAIVVLPQGVAFATIAGMPPEYGLYAAMVPAVIGALFGSSWHLVSGPTTAISLVVFAIVSKMADPGTLPYVSIVLTLAFMTGVMQLVMGLFRLGTLVNFISHSVVIGFTSGAGLLIITTQVPNFLDLSVARGLSVHETYHRVWSQLSQINPFAVAVGAITLVTGIGIRRRFPRFPYMIAAMLAGGMAAALLDLLFGADRTLIRTVGALPAGLPPLSNPIPTLDTVRELLPSALAITMLALTEAVSIARAIAVRSHQRIDGNREFIGQGLSNLLGSFFSAYPSSGSFNRSGLNFDAGARTPMAAVYSAIFLILILLAVAPLAAFLPIPAMAAVLFMVGWSLVDTHHIRSIFSTSRQESAVLATTLLATLFVELEFAIYFGVILSLMLYLNRTAHPTIRDIKPDPTGGSYHFSADTGLPDCPQLKMLRINGSLFFGAVNHVQQVLHEVDASNPGQKHLLIAASGINFVDVAGAEMLSAEAARRRALGGGLYLHRAKDEVMDFLRRGNYIRAIGPDMIFPARGEAVGQIIPRLDPEICRRCSVRIFRQCPAPNAPPREHD